MTDPGPEVAAVSSPVDEISNRFVDANAALNPIEATNLGIAGFEELLTDYSADGCAARADLKRRTIAELAAAPRRTDHDRIAAAQLTERLALDVETFDAGYTTSDLNTIDSPLQHIRAVFDLMASTNETEWAAIASRMRAVPDAFGSYRSGLETAQNSGRCSALRQIMVCAQQARNWAGSAHNPGFFTSFVAACPFDGQLRDDLDRASALAEKALDEFAGFLETGLAPRAPQADPVGRERYELAARSASGAILDLEDTYAWGWEELARLRAEQRLVADQILPGATLAEAVAALDNDPARRIVGAEPLRAWIQDVSDQAVADLADVHFDIPEPLRHLECMLAPPGGASGAYYSGPSEDFRRPGRMWWSLPPKETSFGTWREKTIAYHEGVPGHHLQIGQTIYRADTLNRFQRMMSFVPGHGEGWALYAERLMAELGYLEDPGDRMGMLLSQVFRAARVVVDIGMHLELTIPVGFGFAEGERWTPSLGYEFLHGVSLITEAFAADEINRYLGWPGQAISYKVGERVWLQARADAETRHGSGFDPVSFHRSALDLGGMGLDLLRQELAQI